MPEVIQETAVRHCVLPYQLQKAVQVHALLFTCFHCLTQLSDRGFQVGLFPLIVGGHFHKSLIRQLSADIVLIKPLDDAIDLADAPLLLLQRPSRLGLFPHLRPHVIGHGLVGRTRPYPHGQRK